MVILEYMDFQNMITKNGNLSQTSVFYLCTQYYIYIYVYVYVYSGQRIHILIYAV